MIHEGRVRLNYILHLSTALYAHGTWTRRRSTSLCSNRALSRGRRSSPHAAPTVAMGSSLQQAARMAPSRSGTETSAWVFKHMHARTHTRTHTQTFQPQQCAVGCKHRMSGCYGLGCRVMGLGSSGHRAERSEFNKSLTSTDQKSKWLALKCVCLNWE